LAVAGLHPPRLPQQQQRLPRWRPQVLYIGDDRGQVTRLTFVMKGWHICNGKLPEQCHDHPEWVGVDRRTWKAHEDGWVTNVRAHALSTAAAAVLLLLLVCGSCLSHISHSD
jgi:hypothetical protein